MTAIVRRPRTLIRRALLLTCCAAALGCRDNPVEFVDRTPMNPPSVYSIWFEDVALCMEREEEASPERFREIEWFSAEEIHDSRLGDHQNIWGNWIEPHEITIRTDALLNRPTVTHELVHDFLQTTGHDSPFFAECAGP